MERACIWVYSIRALCTHLCKVCACLCVATGRVWAPVPTAGACLCGDECVCTHLCIHTHMDGHPGGCQERQLLTTSSQGTVGSWVPRAVASTGVSMGRHWQGLTWVRLPRELRSSPWSGLDVAQPPRAPPCPAMGSAASGTMQECSRGHPDSLRPGSRDNQSGSVRAYGQSKAQCCLAPKEESPVPPYPAQN